MLSQSHKEAFLHSRFISYLDEQVKAYLVEHADIVEVEPGSYLHRKGDTFCGIYCLLFGKMKATGVTKEGIEYSLAHVMPGAVVGEIAYLDGGDRTHDLYALEATTLVKFSKELLDQTSALFPGFHSAIVRLACMHVRQSFSVVDDFLTLSPEQRMAKKLMAMSVLKSNKRVVQINQQELAAWIGISRQSISKTLNKWQRKGFIAITYRQLTLLEPEKIAALYSA